MHKIFFLSFFVYLFFQSSCNSQQDKTSLEAKPFYEKLKADPSGIILDVRTPEEFNGGAMQSALNVDYNGNAFESEVSKMDKSKTYFVYCLAGARSASAANWMRKSGFTHVFDLKGGILAWQKEGLPMNVSREKTKEDKISKADYEAMTNSAIPVLIDFYAPWCGPCKKMEPMLNKLSLAHEGKIKVLRINIDENKKLAKELGITEIPVLKFYKNGKETWHHQGFIDQKSIEKKLKI